MFRWFSRGKVDIEATIYDDPETLETALKDFDEVDPLYHPGPYWQKHEAPLIEYLRRSGLTNMRFGTTDKKDPSFVLRRFSASEAKVTAPKGWTERGWQEERFRRASEYGKRMGARPLSDLNMSTAGNPGDSFVINGKHYTSLTLSYYRRYAYLCQFVDFDRISVIVEIGPGGGMQTEILHKLHPHLTSYLFDIPPQSYICSQYLRAALPGRTKGISETRGMGVLPKPQKGKVHVFNSWQIGLAKNTPIDLFWNAASFNEMEPHLVENYLSHISARAKSLYLMSIMEGSRVGLTDYTRFLPGYDVKGLEDLVDHAGDKWSPYTNSFWSKLS